MPGKALSISLCTIALTLCLACSPAQPKPEDHPTEGVGALGDYPVSITASPLSFDNENPALKGTGRLTFVAGWHLTADADRFGGFSGMVVDGSDFTAITDRGDWLMATVDWRSKNAPLTEARMMPFSAGTADLIKEDLDAESLTIDPKGLLIGFEQEHRIALVKKPGDHPFLPPAYQLADLKYLAENHGIEAMTHHPSGQLLMFAEVAKGPKGLGIAWSVTKDGFKDRSYRGPKGHSPTGVTLLPNGGLLIINRSFSILFGVSIKLVYIDPQTAAGDGILEGVEVGTITPPANIDNMEAIVTLGVEEAGSPLIAMMSDDNFRKAQRTLLLLYKVDLP